jgi:hypothetical protein
MREFPPRLPHQPIFYPVANIEYATHIARDWNTKDSVSGFGGYVTKFEVPDAFLAGFEAHTVGSATHIEYWIPAEQLQVFNTSIQGLISLNAGFFGPGFQGHIPDKLGLKGKDAVAQFVAMAETWDYSPMDFICEVKANQKTVFLNLLFWAQFDFTDFGVDRQRRGEIVERIRFAWNFNHIELPLPK